ncbi:MAG: ATP-binding protein [Candidatus Izemoplasmatales bacterium]|jgi:tRNA 2-thiocytidine biosynthesis protein TtcA
MRQLSRETMIERSLMKSFKGSLYSKFVKAISDYKLIDNGDVIAVAISGGKDSLLLAKLFQTFKKYGQLDFEMKLITIDPGYTEDALRTHKNNCEKLGMAPSVYPTKLFAAAKTMSPDSPCYLCARMRRGVLYGKAKELGCNKLALGHHFNDVIETTLLNIFYAGCFKTMLPKAKAENYENMELIRPMYLIKEKDIIKFSRYHDINISGGGCPAEEINMDSKRNEIKKMIESMLEKYKNIDINIFRSAENVNIKNVLGYYDEQEKHSFLDQY